MIPAAVPPAGPPRRRGPRAPLALIGASLAASVGAAVILRSGPPRRPNVVLVVVDTLRADALGSYDPASRDLTPELDALAARAVRFASVTAQSSWTRPSIAALLTGRHPRNLGLYREEWDALPGDVPTLAEILRGSGYDTFGITANPNINRVFGFARGFDTYTDSDVVWEWMAPRTGQRTHSRRNLLPASREVLGRVTGWARGRTAERPACVLLDLMEVHEGSRLVRPEFRAEDRGRVGIPPGYWDGVRQLSHDIGGFVDELASLPGWRNTLFVITSDHGQGLDDHPTVDRSWGHGLLLYETNVRVPAILYRPPGEGGLLARLRPRPGHDLRPAVVRTPIRLMDLMPTILDYVGVPLPPGLDGRSVLSLARGGPESAAGLPRWFVSETRYHGSEKIALHSRRWTLVENRDGHAGVNRVELQVAGGGENGTLTDRISEHPGVAEEMRRRLREWEARFPGRPPTSLAAAPSQETVDQLRALGYVN